MKTTDKALLLTGFLLVVFIAAVFACIWAEKAVPDSLIYCVIGSGTAEFGLCGWVYNAKKKSDAAAKKSTKKKAGA